MYALTLQFLRFVGVRQVARLSMSITHTPTSYRDILDAVEVL